jgi:hypothetical protein
MAISRDEPGASSSFARAYGIAYPLLSDGTGAVSRAYTGVDDNDHTVPGVVIVRHDGKVVFRQVAETKDDRLSPRQILAAADRALGTSETAVRGQHAIEPATPAIDRVQLRVDAGGAFADERAAVAVAAGVHVPIARYVVVGLEARAEIRDTARTLAGGALGVRLPIYGDIAALQLTGMLGLSLADTELYAGARAGIWFAWTPRWAIQLEGGLLAEPATDVLVTFGVSRLFGR